VRLDQRVLRAVYRHFVERGEAPAESALARALAVPEKAVRAALLRLAAGHLLVLRGRGAESPTEILMAMPFSAVPTPFRVATERGAWWANCAWDALGVAAALGAEAWISTRCAESGEPLAIEVRAGACRSAQPCVAHFLVPAARIWDDIVHT
jgi:hypothetical protein